MRRLYSLSLLLPLLSVVSVHGKSPADSLTRSDSNTRHPLVIVPSFGYGELPFLEGPMADAIYYNGEHNKTGSPLFNCSVDYLLLAHLNINASIGYQTTPFNSMNIEQYYYYQYASNPYSFIPSPAFEFAIDYYRSDTTSIGLVASYQSIRCSSLNGQSFYPTSVLFQEYTLGLQSIYFFNGRFNKRLQFYIGARLDVCLWNEADKWNNNFNNQYIPVIVSSAIGLVLPNSSQFSMTLFGGMRYFFTSHLGVQMEAGFGFGSPYYSQAGLVFLLNNGKLKDAIHK